MPDGESRFMRHPADEGFTLVEVILAMTIIVIVMAAMLGVLLSSIATIAQARQRQTATALATQGIELMRALPYDTVTQPDGVTAVPPGFPHTATSGSGYDFKPAPAAGLGTITEPLVVNSRSPRLETQVVDEVTYTIRTYVSLAALTPAPADQQAYNLTALVTWDSTVSNGTRTTAQRSVAYSPAGCLSTAQSPFAAPCQAYFTAQAGQNLAGVTVTNPLDSRQAIVGFDGNVLELTFASHNTSALVEQTAAVGAASLTGGGRALLGAYVEPPAVQASDVAGGTGARATADSDPSTAVGDVEDFTVTGSSGTAELTSATGQTLRATPTGPETVRAAAGVLAGAPLCTGVDGAGLTTGNPGELRPCSSARIQPGANAGMVEYLPGGAFGFGSLAVPLVRVGVPPQPSTAVSAELAANNADACTNGVGPAPEGCAYSAAERTLGSVTVASGAGATTVPPLWNTDLGLWRLGSLTESVRTEEGKGARVPSYTRAGHLDIWNGTDYTPVELIDSKDPGAPLAPYVIPETSITYTSELGKPLVLTFIDGSVTVQRPQVDIRPPTASRTGDLNEDCDDESCLSNVSAGSVVSGNMTVVVTLDGTEITRFAVSTSVGGLTAEATFKAAPDAP